MGQRIPYQPDFTGRSRGISAENMMPDQEKIFTVSEISTRVKALLEGNFDSVWIKGEISNFSTAASGHVYFTLKDESNQLKAAYFYGASKVRSLDLKDGQEITALGRVTAYGKRSEYQVIIKEILVTGIGALLVEYEKLKKKLEEKGLFKADHKRSIPPFPRKIGVVTSRTGAAIRDVINIITRRYSSCGLLIYPVMVQGDEAPGQIVRAINDLNEIGGLDVILVTRGGGSMEDLWAFNDEKVAYAIYDSAIPVVSAVGHEIDFTIADFVADMRAPTPSAAAELLVPDDEQLILGLDSMRKRMSVSLSGIVGRGGERLNKLMASYGFKMPFKIYEDSVMRFDELNEKLTDALDGMLKTGQDRIVVLKDKLGLLNPLAILKKGYSVVYDQGSGKIVTNSDVLEPGRMIDIKLYKGEVTAEITLRKK
jgi:exodeoxyribonuclease VII large subunit